MLKMYIKYLLNCNLHRQLSITNKCLESFHFKASTESYN